MRSCDLLSLVLFALALTFGATQDTATVSPDGEARTTNATGVDDSSDINTPDSVKQSGIVTESIAPDVEEKGGQTATEGKESNTGPGNITSTGETKSSSATIQKGPFIDLLGPSLLSLNMVDETHAQLEQHHTNEALSGKKVIGLYFSADWCGPCRQFTPELVNFYNKMNARRGKEGQFEIVWVSRCRDVKSFGQYFTHMNWLALPPEKALGGRGQELANKMKVKGIPHLVLLDEVGNVITYDARNKIPMDKAGIGFPWRSPISILINLFVPKSLRLLLKDRVTDIKNKVVSLTRKDKK